MTVTSTCERPGQFTLLVTNPFASVGGDGAKVIVKGAFENEGFALVKLSEVERAAESDVPEYLKIRGYKFVNKGAAVYEFDQPGDYTVEA